MVKKIPGNKLIDFRFLIKSRILLTSFCLLSFVIFISFSLFSQNPKSSQDDGAGFKHILTDDTFKKWKGNRDYWRFENGVLIGEITKDNPLEGDFSFLVWDELVKDFELKVEYRISSRGNSGIYYRSNFRSDRQDVLLGYQADMDGINQWTGALYENFKNRGHQGLALKGQVIHVGEDDTRELIGSTGNTEMLASFINDGRWNEYHIIARDNTIIQMINGHVMSVVIDDAQNRVLEGHLGVQLHQGPPMKVQFRNMRLREY